uniref:Uncharacterized protein n=1 Tax=blood disease bacterium R229 TaxID=741978 RepID=G2ZUW8_9RALS|nr:hypothetical protein BDB_mp50001 [blood disease bacterium R229]
MTRPISGTDAENDVTCSMGDCHEWTIAGYLTLSVTVGNGV